MNGRTSLSGAVSISGNQFIALIGLGDKATRSTSWEQALKSFCRLGERLDLATSEMTRLIVSRTEGSFCLAAAFL